LLNRCNVYPNAYYNFLKNRKAKYHSEKQHILAQIEEIYHSHNGIDGYRKMKIYLFRRKIKLSPLTVHKYMNTELQLRSVVRRKKPVYRLLAAQLFCRAQEYKMGYRFHLSISFGRFFALQLFDNRFVRQECGRQPYRLEDDRFFGNSYFKGRVTASAEKTFRIDFTFGSGCTIYFSRIHFFLQLGRRDSEYEPRRFSLRQFSHGTLFQHLKDRTHLSL